MTKDIRIDVFQLFALLYTGRLLTTVTFSPIMNDGLLSGNSTLSIIFAAIFVLSLCVVCAAFYKRFPLSTPVSAAPEKLRFVFAFFYSVLFLFFASVSLSRFYFFLTSVIYPEKNMDFFLVIAVLLCAYCAYLGLEALSRGNAILLFIIVAGVCVILFTVAEKFDFYNLDPVFYQPVSQSVGSGFFAAMRTVETTVFLFLASKTKGNMKKGFAVVFVLFFLSIFILFLFLGGVAGKFAETQLFPFYSLAVIAEFPFIERLDAVVTAMFVFSILIKCSVLMYISSEQIKKFPFMNKKRSLLICFAVISVLSLVFSKNVGLQKTVGSPYLFTVLTVTASVAIPVFELLKTKKGSRI